MDYYKIIDDNIEDFDNVMTSCGKSRYDILTYISYKFGSLQTDEVYYGPDGIIRGVNKDVMDRAARGDIQTVRYLIGEIDRIVDAHLYSGTRYTRYDLHDLRRILVLMSSGDISTDDILLISSVNSSAFKDSAQKLAIDRSIVIIGRQEYSRYDSHSLDVFIFLKNDPMINWFTQYMKHKVEPYLAPGEFKTWWNNWRTKDALENIGIGDLI